MGGRSCRDLRHSGWKHRTADKQEDDFGAFFDSTLDRYSDMFLFIGLAYYFAGGRPF